VQDIIAPLRGFKPVDTCLGFTNLSGRPTISLPKRTTEKQGRTLDEA